jgi:hypothetical protein
MYLCDICNYLTATNHSLKIHYKTKKHINLFNTINSPPKIFYCSICSKEYTHQSSYSRHKKKCNIINEQIQQKIQIEQAKQTDQIKTKYESEIDNLKKEHQRQIELEKIKSENIINIEKIKFDGLLSIKNLEKQLKIKEIETTNYIEKLNTTQSNQPKELNNQLIDIILDKNKVIEGLKTTIKKKPELQVIEESENIDLNEIIKMQDQKIKILEDLFVKKQKRQSFPEKNVIYILTTEENKKNRIYIIGKAKELKNRLSTYNKTAEHEVIYYKGCNDEDDLKIIEQNVLRKLRNYKEKANRDRFVLPIEKDITFFTKVIDHCINDIDNDNLD